MHILLRRHCLLAGHFILHDVIGQNLVNLSQPICFLCVSVLDCDIEYCINLQDDDNV